MAGSSALRAGTSPPTGSSPGAGPSVARDPDSARPPVGGAPASWQAWWDRGYGLGTELLTAAALTLGFFATFLALLAVVFPSGMTLRALVSQLPRSDLVASGEASATGSADGRVRRSMAIASLTVLQRDVRSKPSSAVAWNPANSGQELYDRDGVQTGAQGRASVAFGVRNELRLEPNSLIILTTDRRSGNDQAQGDVVVMLEGEIWARFAESKSMPARVVFSTAGGMQDATAEISGPSEFRLRVDKDRGATFSVHRGTMDLHSGSKRVTIGPRQFGRISSAGALEPSRPLPSSPAVRAPQATASYLYRDLPPRIEFLWSAVPEADRYRVVVARDRDVREVVVDEVTSAPALASGRIKEGDYVWRVSALAADAEGAPSEWRSISVQRKGEPPQLSVQPLPKVLEGSTVRLRGRIERVATVYVAGARVTPQPDGSFEFNLTLQPGVNVVVVEAVDALGNTSYWSQVVNAKF